MSKETETKIDGLIKELTALKRVVGHPDFIEAVEMILNRVDAGEHLEFLGPECSLAFLAAHYTIDLDASYKLVLKDVYGHVIERWVEGNKEWVEV